MEKIMCYKIQKNEKILIIFIYFQFQTEFT